MKTWSFSLAIVLALSQSTAWAAGKIMGKVDFTGKAPKPDVIKMNSDSVCAAAHTGKVFSDDFVVNDNKTLAYIFVYVSDGIKKELIPAAPTTPVDFDQVGCMYKPSVLGIRAGQTLHILNGDATMHNVHAMPKENTGFNVGMAQKGNTKDRSFGHAEMGVHIKCDVHPWMNAYINVMDHPYFAVTDNKGNYTIDGLPPGEYTVTTWHHNPKVGSKTQKVTVKEGAAATANFSY
jgi:plastocyanin